MANDIFESSVRSSGDLAAVYECDGDGGYFYLFDLTKEEGQQARGVLQVGADCAELQASGVSVRWSASQEFAGLFIAGVLTAAIDQNGHGYGGIYGTPSLPPKIIGQFGCAARPNDTLLVSRNEKKSAILDFKSP